MGYTREAREFLPEHHWAWVKPDEKPTYLLPQFTRDIAAAWEVHRAMLSRDPQTKTRYLYALADMLIDKFVGRSRPPSVWTALLEYFDEDTICRAALLAVAEVNERVKQIDCV